jgi:activator of HSP90 ATPase
MAKTIKQKVKFKKSPHDVYEMLMDSKKHSEFTGDTAKIANKVGGKFTAYGGYIEGTNLELVPDKKIVQKWRGSDWQEGVYSEATYTLKPIKTGTELTFEQKGVPDEQYEDIKKGWYEFYWDKMQ